MAGDDAEPLTLEGLEDAGLARHGQRQGHAKKPAAKPAAKNEKKSGKKPAVQRKTVPAANNPIAHVMLDEQAAHLGRAFDYLIPESMSEKAQPGARVRVPFGSLRKDGVIWARDAVTDIAPRALRPLAAVVSIHPVLDEAMRRDIEAIADAFGGTIPNIVRLAVPSRVAYVDKQRENVRVRKKWSDTTINADEQHAARIRRLYENGDELIHAVENPQWGWTTKTPEVSDTSNVADTQIVSRAPRIIWDSLPGTETWADDVAWVALHALRAGRSIVIVLPDTRHVAQVRRSLQSMGLHSFAPAASHTPSTSGEEEKAEEKPSAPESAPWQGDFAILLGSDPQDMRYRAYLAVADGAVKCVIGTRAAMYAPTGANPVFLIVDDMVYQNADGFMPYPNARGVLDVRAHERRGLLIVAGHARSALSQEDCARDDGRVLQVHGTDRAVAGMLPDVQWLDRERLEAEGDPTPWARIPVTVMQWLRSVADEGPVLVSIPEDMPVESLICASCHRRARCARCAGPLVRLHSGEGAKCLWCGAPAAPWACPECEGRRLSAPRQGARSTIRELAGLFRGVPCVASTKVQGAVPRIPDAPCLVVATPWFEPFIDGGEYRAAVILDAWESRYAPGLDARIDTLVRWMHAVSLVRSALDGGRALLLGDTFPELGESLTAWDPRILGRLEVEERTDAGLPPAVVAAAVWGAREAVEKALLDMGTLDGDMAEITVGDEELPAVLGPVSIREIRGVPRALDLDWNEEAGEGDAMGRVRAVVRVEPTRAGELAARLHQAAAKIAAAGYRQEFRFQMYPKDLM